MGLCFSTWASRIPDIKELLQLSPAMLGSILFAMPIGQFIALPFSGGFVTQFGSNRVLTVAILLYASGLALIGLAFEPWQLALALLFFGIAGNLSNISVNTQGVAVEKLYERPIMASFHGAWSIAGFTGALLGLGAMALKLTPYQHFLLVVVIVGVTVFSFKDKLMLTPPLSNKAPQKSFFSKPGGILFPLGLIGFLCMATEGAVFDWSGIYFKEVIKVRPVLVPLGFASFMVMMAGGRFVADKLIAKFGRQRVLFFSGMMISTGMLTAVCFPYVVPATIAFLVVGFGVSAVVPTVYSVAGRSSATPGVAIAAVTSVSFLGILVGPLIGWIASASSLRVSYAFIGLFGFGISYLVSRMRGLD